MNPNSAHLYEFLRPTQPYSAPENSSLEYPSDYSTQLNYSQSTEQTTGFTIPDTQFTSHVPIVHEGFIPAAEYNEDNEIGNRVDAFDTFTGYHLSPSGFESRRRESFKNNTYFDGNESSIEDGSDLDPATLGEDLLGSLPDANNDTVDPDYSASEVDQESQDDISEFEVDRNVGISRTSGLKGNRRRGLLLDSRSPSRHRQSTIYQDAEGLHGFSDSRMLHNRRRRRTSEERQLRGAAGKKRGPRRADPGLNYKILQAKATKAFLNNEYSEALEYARNAVESNPEIFASHSLLAAVWDAMGEKVESVNALLVGAHVKRDPATWWHVAERVQDLEEFDREIKLKQAYNCYTQILALDREDHAAREKKIAIDIERGLYVKAHRQCEKLLKLRPDDTTTLRQLAELSVRLGEIERAVVQFEQSIVHFTQDQPRDTGEFDWSLLNIFLDLLISINDHGKALTYINTVSRWLLGRKDEVYWDSLFDDREWDMDDFPRRVDIMEFSQGNYPIETYGQGLPLEIRIKLGICRLEMGQGHLREALHHFEILNPKQTTDSHNVIDYGDLFRDVADVLSQNGHHREALRYYEPLRKSTKDATTSLYMALARCYIALNKPDDASSCLLLIMNSDQQNIEARVELAKLYEKLGLTEQALHIAKEVIELEGGGQLKVVPESTSTESNTPSYITSMNNDNVQTNDSDTLANIRFPGNDYRQYQGNDNSLPDVLPVGIPPKIPRTRSGKPLVESSDKKRQYEAKRQEIQDLYRQLRSLEPKTGSDDLEAIRRWMEIATLLIGEFRAFRPFYPTRKIGGQPKNRKFTGYTRRKPGWKDSSIAEMAAMANRLQKTGEKIVLPTEDIPVDFHGITFNHWLEIFCMYAYFLARQGLGDECWDTMRATSTANVFSQDTNRARQIHICWLAYSLILNDEVQLCHACRWFIKSYPYASDAFRLYSAANGAYQGMRISYSSGPAQKFILRAIKQMDFALLDPKNRALYQFTDRERSGYTNGGKSDGNPHHLINIDPTVLVLYAHLLSSRGAHASALNYYFRAYAIVPYDPIVCLCIATCYAHQALKRLSENRHYRIQQAISFLFKYYSIRTKDGMPLHIQEAEFNTARMWHMLGLPHLALPAYERCIYLDPAVRSVSKRDGSQVESFTAEAAYAIQSILSITEDFVNAGKIARQWLVLE